MCTSPINFLDWSNFLYQFIRLLEDYFTQKGYMPYYSRILQPSIGFDPANDVYRLANPDGADCFLRTSPERNLKLALAEYRCSLFEIGKVFRGGADNRAGPVHRNEFWMCEWYTAGADFDAAMAQLKDMMAVLWRAYRHAKSNAPFSWHMIAFDALFKDACGQDLSTWLASQSSETPETVLSRLDYVYAHHFVPALAAYPGFALIYDFPQPMAALAAPAPATREAPPHARRYQRWELSFRGIELLNGYIEITDTDQLAAHINSVAAYRAHAAHNQGPLLDSAMRERLAQTPLPPCAGFALGIDRLLMILLGQDCIPNQPCYDP